MMIVVRWTLIASVVWLLLFKCHVTVAQETVDMGAWQDESPKMAVCECKGKNSDDILGEKHLKTIQSIIKDVRGIYTDCSTQTEKVSSLKSQNKYLLGKVEHLEGDITALDKELQILMYTRKNLQNDHHNDVIKDPKDDVTGSGECERTLYPYSEDNAVSKAPTSTITFGDLEYMKYLNNTITTLEYKISRLENTSASRRRKLRLVTKKNLQQRTELNRLQLKWRAHIAKAHSIQEREITRRKGLEVKVNDLSRVVRTLARAFKNLEEKQRETNRKYRQAMQSVIRLKGTRVDTS